MGFYTPPAQTGDQDKAFNVSNVEVNVSNAAGAMFQKSLEDGFVSMYRAWELGNIRESALEGNRGNLIANDLLDRAKSSNPLLFPIGLLQESVAPNVIDLVRDDKIDLTSPLYHHLVRKDAEFIDPEEANARGAEIGLDKFKNPVLKEAFDYLWKNKVRENRLNSRISRARDQFGSGTVMFASSLAGAAIDPINIASSFIPVFGQGKWAKITENAFRGSLARAASKETLKGRWAKILESTAKSAETGRFGKVLDLTARSAQRFSVGASNAFVGNIITEPIIFTNKQTLMEDYTKADALNNIALGTVVGGGLHVGVGLIKDIYGKVSPQHRRDGKPLSDYEIIFRGQKELPKPTDEGFREADKSDYDIVFNGQRQLPKPPPLLLTDGSGRTYDLPTIYQIQKELDHGYGDQLERFATDRERNAFLALSVDSVINGRLPQVEALVEASKGIKEPEFIGLEDMPVRVRITKLEDDKVKIEFRDQPTEFSVPYQIGENFDDAASKLIGTFLYYKRRMRKGASMKVANFKKVKGVKSTYASGAWTIAKVGKKWELKDSDGNVKGSYRTLKEAKESNLELPDAKFEGTKEDILLKQFEEQRRQDNQNRVVEIAERLREISSPEYFRQKLIEVGYPVRRFEKLEAEIAYRQTEGREKVIERAAEGKGRKRLRLYDQETVQKEVDLKLEKRQEGRNLYEQAKTDISGEAAELRNELATLRKDLELDPKVPRPMTEADLENQARAIQEAESWLADKKVALELGEILKVPERFFKPDPRKLETASQGKALEKRVVKETVRKRGELTVVQKDIKEDTDIVIEELMERVRVADISLAELSEMDAILQGDAPRLMKAAPVQRTPNKVVRTTVVHSFDDSRLDAVAREQGFEDMADFRLKVMADPEQFKELGDKLPAELRAAIKDTLDRQESVKYAMDRGATAEDVIATGRSGGDIKEKIPQNEYDVEISKARASAQLIADYIRCRKT